ncbi:MAG: hypothetical protein FWH41_07345 [Treponema sp.]|nr:hypothetical protein [Treponema sp.]
MSRGILITGNDSAVLRAIEAEAGKRVEQYAAAAIHNRLSGNEGKTYSQTQNEHRQYEDSARINANKKQRILLDWNPGSPVTARTLILAAENRLERITEAILVCNPPSIRYAASEIKFADVEVLVNDHIKSWFFLLKELAINFKEKGDGILALVFPETAGVNSKDDTADLFGAIALSSFRTLAQGLLATASQEPYFTMGFSGVYSGDEDDFAAFIFKHIDEKNRRSSGKLFKFGKGFFR